MKKWVGYFTGILVGNLGWGMPSLAQTAEQDALIFSAGLQHLYDSNFMRSPEEIEDQITRAGAGVSYNKQFSAQKLALSLNASQYLYAEHDDLDASAYGGRASWLSQFTANVSTELDWRRDEVPVDKLEFVGKDLIANSEANARLSLGDSKRFGFLVGLHQLDNTHSNVERRDLDFQDRDYFTELRYRFASSSWMGLRYREGERIYEMVNTSLGYLDFDYDQLELETAWNLTPKTTLTGLVGYFDRTAKPGADSANDGEGSLASLKLEWDVTEKLVSEITYRFNQPAVGETTDAASEISDVTLLLQWQVLSKVQLGFGGSYSELNYEESEVVMERIERNITASPLLLTWTYSDAMLMRLSTQWMDRRSPVPTRDYQGYSASLSFAFHF